VGGRYSKELFVWALTELARHSFCNRHYVITIKEYFTKTWAQMELSRSEDRYAFKVAESRASMRLTVMGVCSRLKHIQQAIGRTIIIIAYQTWALRSSPSLIYAKDYERVSHDVHVLALLASEKISSRERPFLFPNMKGCKFLSKFSQGTESLHEIKAPMPGHKT
jgi:hypothetical protein